MPAQQPTLDGTLPTPAPDYHTWCDQVRPAFVEAARTGQRFTTYEIARENDLPEPPCARADWGNFTQSLVRDGLLEHCGFDRSLRPTGEHSAVSVWRGTRAAQAGRAA
ncbi:hypothetical protein [Streptomyces antibioticus]|uniref:Uncharacterized protein n=1 Tax=Streptomyces antibioticus TaxID=1890 RepID=A0AAE6YEY3_STRAT|nr:hypothetical protein [Streptomyces antibioticus]OOQ47274.1 hypothetical protein AFM16_31510 [Streptomyces antibioticus]QIT47594.1 hypothetical protein HCX60_32065 [Streptomyces antibioticus]